jgi:hypothetical protein
LKGFLCFGRALQPILEKPMGCFLRLKSSAKDDILLQKVYARKAKKAQNLANIIILFRLAGLSSGFYPLNDRLNLFSAHDWRGTNFAETPAPSHYNPG